VQIFDHRPAGDAEAARRAEAAGAFLIDINMGCPVRKIARKGGGSGLAARSGAGPADRGGGERGRCGFRSRSKRGLGWCGKQRPIRWALPWPWRTLVPRP